MSSASRECIPCIWDSRVSFLLITLCVCCVAELAPAQVEPPVPTPAAGAPSADVPLTLQVPKTPAEVEACRAQARARMDALAPSLPAEEAALTEAAQGEPDSPLKLRVRIYRQWEAYMQELDRLVTFQEQTAAARQEEHLRELGRRVEELRQRAADLRRESVAEDDAPGRVEEVAAWQKEYAAQLADLSARQAERTALLSTGFKQRRDELEARLQALQPTPTETPPAAEPATSASELAELRLRLKRVTRGRVELALHVLALERELTDLRAKQDEQYLEPLRGYVTALQERLRSLQQAKGTQELAQIQREQAQTTRRHESAYLALQDFKTRVLLDHFQREGALSALRQRFPASALDVLRDQLGTTVAAWEELSAALRAGADTQATGSRQRLRADRIRWEAELTRRRATLLQALAQLQELRALRDLALQRFDALATELTATLSNVEPAERARIEAEVVSLRTAMDQAIAGVLTEAQATTGRLKEATGLLTEQTAKLRALEAVFFWTALKRPESGLLKLNWQAVGTELRLLVFAEAADTTRGGAAPLAPAGVLGLQPMDVNPRAELRRQLVVVGRGFSAVRGGQWIKFGAWLLALLAGAFLLRWLGRRYSRYLRYLSAAEGEPEPDREDSRRLTLLALEFVACAALPAALVTLAWTAPGTLELTRVPSSLVQAGLSLVGALLFVASFARRFLSSEPGTRLIPCDDVVARHYRRWLGVVWLLTLVWLWAPLGLSALGVAPTLRIGLWEIYKAGVLLCCLGFLGRRARVVGLDARFPTHAGWRFLPILQPILFCVVLVLLALQTAGFGLLVDYVGGALLSSLGLLVLTGAGVEYVCALVEGRDAEDGCDESCAAPGADARKSRLRALPGGWLATSLIRLVGLALVLILVLRVWRLQDLSGTINWQVLSLGSLVVVVALVVDRVAFAGLHALQRAGRVPESTARIIRRWGRGLLVMIAGLCIVALAGYRITGLWAFLTAVMGLVAIGFVAVWSILANVTSTLIILIWRPFNVGERVLIQPDGIEGEVVDINFMYTLLRCDGGARTTVPNSLFLQKFIRRLPPTQQVERSLAEQLEADRPLDE